MSGSRRLHAAAMALVLLLVTLHGSAAAQATPPRHEAHTPDPPPVSDAAPASGHDHSDSRPASPGLPPFIPPLTDEDRRAAFPDVGGHAVHGERPQFFVLFDDLEWWSTGDRRGWAVDGTGWIGGDSHRLWFRLDAGGEGTSREGTGQAFYGRQVSRWWDLLVGVRQDLGDGPSRTWAAVGLQGLAPYWFEVDLTAYVSGAGHVRGRMDVAYDLLFTNRLILQPQLEVELASKSDPDSGIEAGLAGLGAGARLRYELRREFAPYLGMTWQRTTAGGAVHATGATGGVAFVTGLRFWF
jgi:copper resistance protein B